MSRPQLRPRAAGSPVPGGVPAVACERLGFSFDSVRAVDRVCFEVQPGEVFGLLGPNGAGKTTTIRILTTLLPPQEGSAHVFGIDVRKHPMAVRAALGYVPQQLSVDAQLSGYENVWLFARLYGIPRRERAARIHDALETVGLADAARRLASTYSGGMVRRLELAQALVNRPRLLVLDEPTIGLDPIARGDVHERILQLVREQTMTVLLTTHYMEEADQLCDRVALMHRGRIRALGSPAELKAALGPGASLEDVFRHHAGHDLEEGGTLREVRTTRRGLGRFG